MQPKVSFITGVKNNAPELKEMIQTLIDQDMQEWEAIIADDHSEEPLGDIVNAFNDGRLRYFKLPAALTGIANGRNFAISHATAEILLTADGDDINLPNRASITYKEMTENNYDVFYSALNDYLPKENIIKPRKFQPFNTELFRMFNFITNPSTAFRKSLFLKVGQFDSEFMLSEDYDLWLRMLTGGAKFGFTPTVLVNYRNFSKSLTHQKAALAHEYIMKARIKNQIPPFNIEEVAKYALPNIVEDILSENGRKLWRDDRFESQ